MSDFVLRHVRASQERERRDVPAVLRFWLARWTQRRALAALDDDRLRDVGLERREVERECRKPFWR